MKIIKPSFEFLDEINEGKFLKKLEIAGRTCYKSEDKITPESSKKFIRKLIDSGHHAMIEHVSISVKVICDRGVSHEIVRHRIASYAQESTRYCNYSKDKFGGELTFIEPCFWNNINLAKFNLAEVLPKYKIWHDFMQECEKTYLTLIELGALPEEARSVLPNGLKTEIVITMNIREWRHFFALRTSLKAHSQMQEIAQIMLVKFQNEMPVLFGDIIFIDKDTKKKWDDLNAQRSS